MICCWSFRFGVGTFGTERILEWEGTRGGRDLRMVKNGSGSGTSLVLGIVAEIYREGRRNFRDLRTDMRKELCTLPVD